MVIAWWRRYGSDDVSTAQLLALIEELGLDWDWGEAKDDQGKRVGLGRALGGERFEMVLEDLQIRRSDKKRHGSWWWHLTPVGPHTPPREVGGD